MWSTCAAMLALGLNRPDLPGADDAGHVGRHTESDAGLASGLINTTLQVGGALGLAVVTLATARTDDLRAEGDSLVSALADNYQLALVVGAGLLVVAVGLALAVLRPEPQAAAESQHREEESPSPSSRRPHRVFGWHARHRLDSSGALCPRPGQALPHGHRGAEGRVARDPRASSSACSAPTGAGKSTLIHCATGLARPTGGDIRAFGHDAVENYGEARMAVGLAPQELNLDWFLTVAEQLDYHAGYFPECRAGSGASATDKLLGGVLAHRQARRAHSRCRAA